ncbi:hypothetical protein [Streptomyces sp. NPDC046939]|uniref:hypothetical protein n=1 Tax=Streptomyces sp. NPDC046939 TaxID=3155376 RepID=UPI0033C2D3AC
MQRRDIVDSHPALFAKFLKGTQLADEILDVRFYGPDTALVTGRGHTYKGSTKRKPLMEAISFPVTQKFG